MSSQSKHLTHLNADGEAHMVNVGDKPISHRVAIAAGRIDMQAETLEMISRGDHAKGDVLAVARVAGIMAAKKTAELVPLCHPVALTNIQVDLTIDESGPCIQCRTQAETRDQTGVEMEALTAVQTALLTIYDMCKAVDRGMHIEAVRLLEKSGGRSGHWQSEDDQ